MDGGVNLLPCTVYCIVHCTQSEKVSTASVMIAATSEALFLANIGSIKLTLYVIGDTCESHVSGSFFFFSNCRFSISKCP